MRLAATTLGAGAPVLFLHGLLGRARNWQTMGRTVAADHAVWLVDLRNHGASPWSDEMSYPAMARDVAGLIEEEHLAPVTLVGHSMGGKVAMVLALTRPELLARLIVVDIAPIGYRHGFEHFVRAMLDADLSPPRRRTEIDQALAASIPEPAMRAFLMQNLESRDGAMRWQPNLPVLLRAMDTLTGFPEDVRPGVFEGPARCLRGARSDYVGEAGLAALRRLFPAATVASVADAGHWPHAERPEEFGVLLGRALAD